MHFYDFNIGDYAKKTAHLTNGEDLAYRRALDVYYDTEKPFDLTSGLATLSRRLRVDEKDLKNVIEEFFPDGKNKHADEKIAAYYAYLERQKTNGMLGGRPKLKGLKPSANPVVSQNNPVPSQPLPTTHLPLPKVKKYLARGARLSPDWKLPLEWGNWALQEKQGCTTEDVRKCAERFKDYWISVAGSKALKVDWMATWRTWVRRDTEIGMRQPARTNVKIQEAERILGKSTFKSLEMRDVTEND